MDARTQPHRYAGTLAQTTIGGTDIDHLIAIEARVYGPRVLPKLLVKDFEFLWPMISHHVSAHGSEFFWKDHRLGLNGDLRNGRARCCDRAAHGICRSNSSARPFFCE